MLVQCIEEANYTEKLFNNNNNNNKYTCTCTGVLHWEIRALHVTQ